MINNPSAKLVYSSSKGAVEICSRTIFENYKERGINCLFEMNAGGHFNEPALRIAKGIAFLLR